MLECLVAGQKSMGWECSDHHGAEEDNKGEQQDDSGLGSKKPEHQTLERKRSSGHVCLSPLHGELEGQSWVPRPRHFTPSSQFPSKRGGTSGAKAQQTPYFPDMGVVKHSPTPRSSAASPVGVRAAPLHRPISSASPEPLAHASCLYSPPPDLCTPAQLTVLYSDGALLSSLGLHSSAILPTPASAVSRQGTHLERSHGWGSAAHMLCCGFGKHLALGLPPL